MLAEVLNPTSRRPNNSFNSFIMIICYNYRDAFSLRSHYQLTCQTSHYTLLDSVCVAHFFLCPILYWSMCRYELTHPSAHICIYCVVWSGGTCPPPRSVCVLTFSVTMVLKYCWWTKTQIYRKSFRYGKNNRNWVIQCNHAEQFKKLSGIHYIN